MNKTKIALVTGSSTGIGAGIAKVLGTNGYTVVVTYKTNENQARQVAEEIESGGGKVSVLQLDVTDEKSVEDCLNKIDEKYGRLDVLVNNAGVDLPASIEECTFEKWQSITRSKIDGNFLCTKYALPLLKEADKSDVIAIMSSLGDRPDAEDAAYSVGTAGVVAFVKSMAVGLAQYGVRVNGVGPSDTRTELSYYKEKGINSDEEWAKLAKANPLGRVTTPEDVGQTVLTVVENPTQFWNGNFIYVTGGSHLS